MRIFCDVDGTLTDKKSRGGNPLKKNVDKLRKLIQEGHEVIIWSKTGQAYVEKFCKDNELKPKYCLSKPDYFIDDHPRMGKTPILKPEEIFKL